MVRKVKVVLIDKMEIRVTFIVNGWLWFNWFAFSNNNLCLLKWIWNEKFVMRLCVWMIYGPTWWMCVWMEIWLCISRILSWALLFEFLLFWIDFGCVVSCDLVIAWYYILQDDIWMIKWWHGMWCWWWWCWLAYKRKHEDDDDDDALLCLIIFCCFLYLLWYHMYAT